ncbi:MAG TPA: fibronectin type III domain-containing protein, partial [Longimicrobiaceae bacterium]|nr:fibronectin type III domain-containing protein [Longimicrobiaceae bacterium]
MLTRARTPLLLAALALTGCDGDGYSTGPGRLDPPEDLRVRYSWVLEGWQGTSPVGRPVVTVAWTAPGSWNGEPFRVYARRTSQGSFLLIATVTSCDGAACRYVDFNVVPGTQYEYFVATADERSGEEARSQYREAIRVPAATRPAAPRADSVFALDNALYLRWRDGGAGNSLWKYQVFLMAIDATPNRIYQLGESDSPGFLDQRARNGFAYTYRVAAVDTLGHVSDLSSPLVGIPRPDYRGELIYAHGDSTARSGFRFASADSLNPVIAGDSPSAQWRLEVA